MSNTFWFFIGIIIVAIVATIIRGRKKMWCLVYLASGDIELMFKTTMDYWFAGNKMVFRDSENHRSVYPNNGHYIMMYRELFDNEVETTRVNLKRMNEEWRAKMGYAIQEPSDETV